MTRSILAVALIVIIAATSMMVFAQANKAERVKDPVCGLPVEKNPELSHTHKGETYYFCTRADMDKFKKEPDKYVKKK